MFPDNGVLSVLSREPNLNNTLVIILAETRASDLTFERFKKNVLDVFNADLALCVGENEREDSSNPFYTHAKYVWSFREQEDWGTALDEICRKRSVAVDWRLLLHLDGILFGGVKGIGSQPGSGAIGLFFRAFLKECLLDNNVIEKYDHFVITRSDFVHDVKHIPLNLLDDEFIWIPDGEHYGGVTDRHAICSRKNIFEYLSIVDPIFDAPEELYFRMSEDDKWGDWNIEKFIKYRLIEQDVYDKVRFIPYTMYTVRNSDGATRWSSGKFNKKIGMFIKYPDEYKSSLTAVKLINKYDQWDDKVIYRHNAITRNKKKLKKFISNSERFIKKKYILLIAIIVSYYLGRISS